MTMRVASTSAAFAATFVLAAAANAQHADVLLIPDFVNGVVTTGAFDDDSEMVLSMNQRVFEAEFGEADPMNPNFADEPGFRALPGDFDGSSWGFNIVDTIYQWNGSDFSTVSPYSMTMNFGPSPDVTSPGMPGGFTPGFSIPVGPGGFDDHLNIFLDAPMDGTADGIYLLTLEVFADGLDASDPIWFVMNRGLSEMEHEAAVDWVHDNLVPAPGAAVVFAGAGLLAARRRRDSQ